MPDPELEIVAPPSAETPASNMGVPPSDTDLPPGTIIVPMEFTPGVIGALRVAGFLTGQETPDALAAAIWGMLADAWRAGVYRDQGEPDERAAANDDAPAETVSVDSTVRAIDQALAATADTEARQREWLIRMGRVTE